MAKTLGVYLYSETINEVAVRGENRSQTINRDLERLYDLYRRAIQETPLPLAEASLLVDCLNGSLVDARSAGMLWANVEDGIKYDGLEGKWEVDGKALVEKLRRLNQVQCLALIDAAERFWALPATERGIEEGVRKCFNISD